MYKPIPKIAIQPINMPHPVGFLNYCNLCKDMTFNTCGTCYMHEAPHNCVSQHGHYNDVIMLDKNMDLDEEMKE